MPQAYHLSEDGILFFRASVAVSNASRLLYSEDGMETLLLDFAMHAPGMSPEWLLDRTGAELTRLHSDLLERLKPPEGDRR